MSSIDLLLDEENELTFQLNIEGSSPSSANCRLIVENKSMSLVFDATQDKNNEVSVVLPPLTHVLKEGSYNMALEVIVDDKYFKPLDITANFEKSVTVTAESVAAPRKKEKLTASLVDVTAKSRSSKTSKKMTTPAASERDVLSEKAKKKSYSDDDIMSIIKALSSTKDS